MQAVLGSWKEIAGYMGKGVRTVQRWERHSGLPVHRPSESSKGVVLAFPAELDKWARRQDLGSRASAQGNLQRNTALSTKLATQTRQLQESAQVLMNNCNNFLKLSQRWRDDSAREEDGAAPSKVVIGLRLVSR